MSPVIHSFPAVLAAFLSIYILLLAFRIILSWFPNRSYGQPYEILLRFTDPYLNQFRRMKLPPVGGFSTHVIVAVLVLVIVQGILSELARTGTINLPTVLAIVLLVVWGTARWIMMLFTILSAIRLVGLFVSRNQTHPFWYTVDTIIRPIATWVNRPFKGRLEYSHSLIASIVFLLLVRFIVGAIISAAVIQLSMPSV